MASVTSIGILKFPCPRCSHPTAIDLATADPATMFVCVVEACGYANALGPTFPRFSTLVSRNEHFDDDALRQCVVDAMSAWFLEWSARDP